MTDLQLRQYMLLAAKAQAGEANGKELNELELLQIAQECAKARWLKGLK